jgi:hypothetical protein
MNVAILHRLDRIFVGGGFLNNRTFQKLLVERYERGRPTDRYGCATIEVANNFEDLPARGALLLPTLREDVFDG